MTTKTYPACAWCKQNFSPGAYWTNSNSCRAAYLLEFIADNPGLSAWEISQQCGMPYDGVTKGLQKARQMDLVSYTSEVREQGGMRYRYFVNGDWREAIDKLAEGGWI